MTVPNKELEDYLDSKADVKEVRLLNWEGIIPSSSFLKAIALERDDEVWQKRFFLFFKSTIAFFSVLTFFFFLLAFWRYLYTATALILLNVSFVVSGVFLLFYKGNFRWICGLFGAVCIALLIFIPDLYFGADEPLGKQLLSLVVLIGLWSFVAKEKFYFVLGWIVLNGAMYAFAFETWLPTGKITWFCFLKSLALMNVSGLAFFEILFAKECQIKRQLMRNSLFFFSFLPFLLPVAQIISLSNVNVPSFFFPFGILLLQPLFGVYTFFISDDFFLYMGHLFLAIVAETFLFLFLTHFFFSWFLFSILSFLIMVFVVKELRFYLNKMSKGETSCLKN